jgi:hypothetical protein
LVTQAVVVLEFFTEALLEERQLTAVEMLTLQAMETALLVRQIQVVAVAVLATATLVEQAVQEL